MRWLLVLLVGCGGEVSAPVEASADVAAEAEASAIDAAPDADADAWSCLVNASLFPCSDPAAQCSCPSSCAVAGTPGVCQ